MTTWNLQDTSCHLLICNGGNCMKHQAEEVTLAIRDEINQLEANRQIHTTRTRCNGRCDDACVVIAYPEGVWYKEMTPELGRELVRRHAAGSRLVEQMVYTFNQRFMPTGRSVKGQEKPSAKVNRSKKESSNEIRSDSDFVGVLGQRKDDLADPNAE
ncbi:MULTISPECIES: (2Fe-2S) ferredoxin domain-containing protein [Paenibacillus]|uniref:(2Fe-2S) ferredoxin domain-containing protein n=1 Tax=Paenibacillus TaxID=44249 RepID=UPI0030FAF7BD